MSIKVMRQARNAFVWNLNTDLDNIPDCDRWAKMLRKNIDDLDEAIANAELGWVGLTDEEMEECKFQSVNGTGWSTDIDIDQLAKNIEAKLKQKNGYNT